MFFKKKDSINEDQMLRIAITATTIFHIVESKFPSKDVHSQIKQLNTSIDNILANIEMNLNDKDLENLRMCCSSLSMDTTDFIKKRSIKFQQGDKGVEESEVTEALEIIRKEVKKFTNR